MKEPKIFDDVFEKVEKLLHSTTKDTCFFVSSGTVEDPDVMTCGWASIGVSYSVNTLMIMVGYSRYTASLIEKYRCFSVTVPLEDMHKELIYVGTHSKINDVNKIKNSSIKLSPGISVDCPHVSCHGITYECKLVYRSKTEIENMDAALAQERYKGKTNYHNMYFGEILRAYEH